MEILGIPCFFKAHAQAKHIRIRFILSEGIVITYPKKVSDEKIRTSICKQKDMIANKITTLAEKGQLFYLEKKLPQMLEFKAFNTKKEISYQYALKSNLFAVNEGLIIRAENEQEQQKILKKWLLTYAQEQLLPLCKQYAEKYNFSFEKIRFGTQKRCWGTCTSKGSVSFNLAVLFIPFTCIEYLIFHEFCHLEHCNHSDKFYTLLEAYLPDYKAREKELKKYSIPAWLSSNS